MTMTFTHGRTDLHRVIVKRVSDGRTEVIYESSSRRTARLAARNWLNARKPVTFQYQRRRNGAWV
jgi:hypothetical protein